jgi:predicted enzyme related to lactoylglutathione lyase
MSEAPAMGLVLDCQDPDMLAGFWSAALNYTHLGTAENYAMLIPNGRAGPKLLLQRVAEAKAGKNRMHLDIETPDVEACAKRLQALGATRTEEAPRHELGHTWVVMADPEGNEFCVCDSGTTESP